MQKMMNGLKKIWPYILLFIFSIFGTFLVFYKGLNRGDDVYFHLTNILEQYNSLINGEMINPISGNLALGLGVGNRLFYSPLPHYTVALIGAFLNNFNISLIDSYKITLVLSVFISGIFMYRFAMHFTNNNKVASLIAAACFVLYPYRLFDAFCRLAFAEAFSFIFLPLFFMGLYDITHFKDKVKSLPFIEIILGGSLLYLSHNITALFMFVAGIIYLLCNIKKIIRLVKVKNYVLYCGISIVLLLGIASIAYVSQFELMGTGLYNISNTSRMWTDIEHVINRTKEEFNYSGFLNLPHINSHFSGYVIVSSLIVGLGMYIVAGIIFIFIDLKMAENKKLRHFHLLISGLVLFLLVSLISRRIETYLGTIIFFLIYIYITYNITHLKNEDNEVKIHKNILFWFSISAIIIMVVMMEEPAIWKVLPSIFLNIQFPWRLWALVQLFASILIGLICYYYNHKKVVTSIMAMLVGLLMVANMPTIEKRLTWLKDGESFWIMNIDESFYDYSYGLGHNKEYIPQVFFQDDYKSEYTNSLYKKVSNTLRSSKYSGDAYLYKPVVLTGNGTIVVNECYAPVYEMDITISENSLIQMPLIYYPGYEIKVLDKQLNKISTIEPINIDGLVAFELLQGEYEVTTNYVGTTARKISNVAFDICIIVTICGLVYALFIENERYKKIKEFLFKNKNRVCN